MAVLEQSKISKILSTGQLPTEVQYCIEHDKRARFHTESTTSDKELEYLARFLSYVRTIISEAKHDVFRHLLIKPIETVSFLDEVFNELTVVFNAPDRFIQHELSTPELVKDYSNYLDSIKDQEFWREKGFQSMKSAINSILIVDLPAQQSEESMFPEPYYFLLDIRNVWGIEVNKNLEIEWICYIDETNKDIFYIVDSIYYYTYQKNKNGVHNLVSQSTHGLGFVPAKSFWSNNFSKDRRIQKKGPISNSLGRLDWLLMQYTFNKHEELRSGFPIEIMYKRECSYRDATGNSCDNGYITKILSYDSHGMVNETSTEQCPECSNKVATLGAGHVAEVEPPQEGQPDMLDAIKRIGAEVDSLRLLDEKIKRSETDVMVSIVGQIKEQSKEAMNETQVKSLVHSRKTVVMDIKTNFEKIHQFAVNTVGMLRYGPRFFKRSIVNYGERFYFSDVNEVLDNIEKAKHNGVPFFELAFLHKHYLDTKYNQNAHFLSKVEVLNKLEPYKGMSLNDMLQADAQFRLDPVQVELKLNFIDYINMFESEFTDIVSFMQFNETRDKIQFIKTKITEYAQISIESRKPLGPESGPEISGSGEEEQSNN